MKFRDSINYAVFIFLGFSVFLVWLAIWMDDTNLITSNGLFKAPIIEQWMNDPSSRLYDPANLLYYSWMAGLAKLIPLDLFLFQKLNIINAFFAAVASGFLFIGLMKLFEDKTVAALGTLFHSGCGYVLGLSITSEDIMPGYTMFMGSLAFMIFFIKDRQYIYLILAASFYLLSWFLHWTLMISWGFSIGALLLLMDGEMKSKLKYFAVLIIFCISIIAIAASLANIPFTEIFLPGKAYDTHWGGFRAVRLHFLFPAISSYFYTYSMQDADFLLVKIILIAGFIFFLFKLIHDKSLRLLFLALLINFIVGEGITLRDDPFNAQFQVQPMIWLTFAFSALVNDLKRIKMPIVHFPLVGLLALVPLVFNLRYFNEPKDFREKDSAAIESLKKIESKINLSDMVLVIHPYHPVFAFAKAIWKDRVEYYTICIDNYSRDYSYDENYNCMIDWLRKYLKDGKTIVTDNVWYLKEDELVFQLRDIRDEEQIRGIYRGLKENFTPTPFLETAFGSLYTLKPNQTLPVENESKK